MILRLLEKRLIVTRSSFGSGLARNHLQVEMCYNNVL
ncbi:hypothetical protein CLOBOL_02603 [Enterocloster bolteae ATCC BAA-613]|uniref:Uncharacterized protein n=1 Tax=Enterocloster bolteae (strain ATCC BAA-613 / DSM 15670 / CCUG 46953 / JCM 12243 / WAL 16351) TaxID=411902 RepID=A8RPY7_ENTBW|nr:hypothetical protein CLOBOL_02603 [Enterocloster bolteae ATCC BAA-613]